MQSIEFHFNESSKHKIIQVDDIGFVTDESHIVDCMATMSRFRDTFHDYLSTSTRVTLLIAFTPHNENTVCIYLNKIK